MAANLYTYRARLLVYVSLLLAFLLGVLVFSYYSSRAVIFGEAENNVARISQQIEGQLAREAHELLDRAKMVRDNAPLLEYIYIVHWLNASNEAVRELYKRQFGWLPISRVVLISTRGRAVLGAEHADLVSRLRPTARGASSPADHYFYINRGHELELVAIAAVRYRSQELGLVAITRVIGQAWLEARHETSGGHLFLVEGGKVALTTTGGAHVGLPFTPANGAVVLGADKYLTRQILFGPTESTVPTLWFALSDAQLTQRLTEQRNLMLTLAFAGSLAILIVGFMLLRNFSAPLSRLVSFIQAVGEGRFPELAETPARDEVGFLTNQFSAMVRNLRDKQEEINRVHAQLEQQATTDSLTGFYNRRHLYDLYPKLWSEAVRQDTCLSVLLIDLDLFKRINDTHGHLGGDQALVHFARVLRSCCRLSDFIFRLGGEEFLVLTGGDIGGGHILAEKIRTTVETTPVAYQDRIIRLTVSIGLAQADRTDTGNGLSALLARADDALYRAKQGGRNRTVSCNRAAPKAELG